MSKFTFQEIRPNLITPDQRYQRELDETRARGMAEDFRPDLFGVPVISKRSGARTDAGEAPMVAVDGQHRLKAAVIAKRGDTPMLMKVYKGLTLQEEAALFLRLSRGQRAIRAYDNWKASLAAQDTDALTIFETLKRIGLKVTKSKQKRGVCAIRAVYYSHHKGNLESTMHVLTAWAEGDPEAYEGELIRAVAAFLSEYHAIDLDSAIKKLRNHSPERVLRKLRGTIGSYDFKPYEAACIVLREIYNERRPKRIQLPPPGQKKTNAEELQENVQRLKAKAPSAAK